MHPPAAPLRVRGRMVVEGCNQSKGGRPRPAAFGRKRSFALGKKSATPMENYSANQDFIFYI
jgi:hypothetical protein